MKFVLIALFFLPFVFAFDITELMYNPSDGNEWVEFYTSSELNFSGYELTDNLNTDQIVCCGSCSYIIPNNTYFLVLDQDSALNFSGYKFCVDDNSIGNSLGNSADKVVITKNGNTLVNLSYQKTLLQGNSLSYINSSWIETSPTPGHNITQNIQEEILPLNDTNESACLNLNCSEINSINQTINCSVNISIETDKTLYEKGEQVKITHVISGGKYPKVYWVEDLFGEIVNEKKESNVSSKKTYTPDFDGEEKSFLLYAELNTSCNNLGTNLASKLITVRGNATGSHETNIEITKIPNKIAFGDLFEVEIRINKGNNRKTAVKVFVEKDSIESEITSLNLLSKNEEIELSLPIKMKDKCGISGKYNLVVEGLDINEKKEIDINALECKTSSSSKSSSSGGSSGSSSSGYISTSKSASNEFELIDFTKEFSDNVDSMIKIINKDTKEHNYTLWSYIYSGLVSFSGEREKNLIKITLKPKEEKEIALKNSLESEVESDAKLKIKILRDDRKTEHEFTEELVFKAKNIEEIKAEEKSDVMPIEVIGHEEKSNQITGEVVYEKEKTSNYLPYLLVPIALILGYIIYKKRL